MPATTMCSGASFDKDLYLESGACMVFWIHNGSNDTLTVDDFNKKFGTNLVENQNIIILENGGMSNSAPPWSADHHQRPR